MAITINGTSGITYNNSSTQSVGAVGSASQTWQALSGSRSTGVTYTNSTGLPIMVCISTGGGQGDLSVNGINLARFDGSGYQTGSAIVPNGNTYSLSGGSIVFWAELR
jgi:hypothetical protein